MILESTVQAHRVQLNSTCGIEHLDSTWTTDRDVTLELGDEIKGDLKAIVETGIFQANIQYATPQGLAGRTSHLTIKNNEVFFKGDNGEVIPLIQTANKSSNRREGRILAHHAREIIRKAREFGIDTRSQHAHPSREAQTLTMSPPKESKSTQVHDLALEELSHTRESLHLAESERDLLAEENKFLRQTLRKKELEIGDLQEENQSLRREIQQLKYQLAESENDLARANDHIRELSKALEKAESKVARAEERAEKLALQYEQKRREFEEQKVHLNSREEELAHSFESQQSQLQELREVKRRCSEAETLVHSLRQDLDSATRQNRALLEEVHTLRGIEDTLALSKAQLQKVQREASQESIRLKAIIEELKKDLQAQRTLEASLELELQELKAALESSTSENDLTRARNEELLLEIAELKSLIELKNKEVLEKENLLIEIDRLHLLLKEQEVALLRAEEKLLLSHELFQREKEELTSYYKAEIRALEESLVLEKERSQAMEEEVSSYQKRCRSLETDIERLHSEYQLELKRLSLEHTKQLATLEEQLILSNSRFTELSKDLERSKRELADTKRELSEEKKLRETARIEFTRHVNALEEEIENYIQLLAAQKKKASAFEEMASLSDSTNQELREAAEQNAEELRQTTLLLDRAILEKQELEKELSRLKIENSRLTEETRLNQSLIEKLQATNSELETLLLRQNDGKTLKIAALEEELEILRRENQFALQATMKRFEAEQESLRLKTQILEEQLAIALYEKEEALQRADAISKKYLLLEHKLSAMIGTLPWRSYAGQTLTLEAALTDRTLEDLLRQEFKLREEDLINEKESFSRLFKEKEARMIQLEKLIRQLESDSTADKKEISTLLEENRILRSEIEELRPKAEAYLKDRGQQIYLRQQLEANQAEKDELLEEIARLEKQLFQKQEAVDILQKANRQKEAENEELRMRTSSDSDAHFEEVQLLKNRHAEAERSLKAEYAQAEKVLKEKIRELEDRIDSLESENAYLFESLRSAKVQIGRYQDEISFLQWEAREKIQAIKDLEALSEQQASKISSLEETLEEKEDLIAELTEALSQESGAIDTLRNLQESTIALFQAAGIDLTNSTSFKELEEKILSLKEEVGNLKRELQEQKAVAEAAIKDFQLSKARELDLLAERVRNQRTIEEQAAELLSLKKELERALLARENAQDITEHLRLELANETATVKHKEELAQDRLKELLILRERLKTTDRTIQEASVTIQELERDIRRQQEIIKEKDQTIFKYKTENDQLKYRVSLLESGEAKASVLEKENERLRRQLAEEVARVERLRASLDPALMYIEDERSSLVEMEEANKRSSSAEEIPAAISTEPSVAEELDVVMGLLRDPISISMTAENAHRLQANKSLTPTELSIEYKYRTNRAGGYTPPVLNVTSRNRGSTQKATQRLQALGGTIGNSLTAKDQDAFIRLRENAFYSSFTKLEKAFDFLHEEHFKNALTRIREAQGAGRNPDPADIELIQEITTKAIQTLVKTCFTSTARGRDQGMEMYPIIDLRCLLLYYRHFYPQGGRHSQEIEQKINKIEQLITSLDLFFSYITIPTKEPGIIGDTTVTFFANEGKAN